MFLLTVYNIPYAVGIRVNQLVELTPRTGGSIADPEHSYSEKRKLDDADLVERGTATKSKTKAPRTRVYNPAWEKEYPWLSTNDGQQLFCSLCRVANMKNAFASQTGACEYISISHSFRLTLLQENQHKLQLQICIVYVGCNGNNKETIDFRNNMVN